MTAENPLILVVDDDPRYVRVITINLRASGYGVTTATSGPEALEAAARKRPDLILLDIMLPGMDGNVVCERIRDFSDVPIIMLTAFGETEDVVKGLDAGADDYIKKPFSAQELLARVRSILRRAQPVAEKPKSTVFTAGELSIDFASRRVFIGESEVQLTGTEYRLLKELAQNVGRVLVPAHLIDAVWSSDEPARAKTLWQAIHRLRKKIEPDPKQPTYIHTRPGIGYVFELAKETPGPTTITSEHPASPTRSK